MLCFFHLSEAVAKLEAVISLYTALLTVEELMTLWETVG
jgi:hypothetical protein